MFNKKKTYKQIMVYIIMVVYSWNLAKTGGQYARNGGHIIYMSIAPQCYCDGTMMVADGRRPLGAVGRR